MGRIEWRDSRSGLTKNSSGASANRVLARRLLAAATVSRQLIRMPRRKQIAPSFSARTYALSGNVDDENEICALQERHLSPMRDGQVRSAVSATAAGSKARSVTIVTKFFVDGTEPPHGPYIFRDNGVEF